MKIIRVSTDLEITVHDFPTGTTAEQNQAIRELIGNDCRLYEHVMPDRLYTVLKMSNRVSEVPGKCVSMLVDEEGCPIAGNILFVGETWGGDGIDFCGIEENAFRILHEKLQKMALALQATEEVAKS